MGLAMASGSRRLLAGLVALVIVVDTTAAIGAAGPLPWGGAVDGGPAAIEGLGDRSERRIGPGFAAALGAGAERGRVEAIAQFRGEHLSEADLGALTALGIEAVRRFDVVPAYHVRGPPGAMVALLDYPGLYFLEPNRPVLFDQEISTTVVNASLVWETQVLGAANFPAGIDGTGITAVVVDTGIDAGHPDLDFGAKVLVNLQETVPGVWTSFENTDTNYGHGTHVAGTVAGNGEASAGARRGVAPGASLIGLTVTIADTAGYLAALEWIYDHSRPGDNPYNIRVFTNSWHTSVGEWDPESALSQAIQALAFENNVVSTWSAGNDGRTDPMGTTITTSQQGTTPVAIVCAAYVHNGSAVADFSSRGQIGLEQTYPDLGAPGVMIWSTSARRTLISSGTYTGGNTNPYYLAISGTSMSTPHVAGAVALLWQAAPSLTISDRHEDYNGSDPDGWEANPLTRIHEIEWILQATSRYLPPDAAHGNPANSTDIGMDGQPHDYVQGYGIIDMRRAVAVALLLEKLRRDNPELDVTVADALREEAGSQYFAAAPRSTDRLAAHWQGEYGRFTDLAQNTLSTANQTKFLFVPPGAQTLEFELSYAAVDIEHRTIGDLTWAVDWDGDGGNDATGSLTPASPAGHKSGSVSVPLERQGTQVAVNVFGNGAKLQLPVRDHVYAEWRSHYAIGVTAVLDVPSEGASALVDRGNYSAMLAPWTHAEPAAEYAGGEVELNQSYFDIRAATLAPPPSPPGGGGAAAAGLALLFVAAAVLALVVVSRSPALRASLLKLPGGALLGRVARALGALAMRVRQLFVRTVARVRRRPA